MVELIPGGAQTISKMPTQFPGAYPRSLVAGDRAHVWAPDGTRYVDWICALGAVTLGYGHGGVDRAVRQQVERGPIFSLPDAALESRVAHRLVELIPCAESVRFVKTGSEATEAAIRIARAATGRDVVLTCGYHSWHSWYTATRPEHPGVPEALTRLARAFRYNDLTALDAFLSYGDVAAVILEPTLLEPPAPGFLEGVKRLADRAGAVLIFDEMVTGFRWHGGGAQAFYGVIPDLATFGKGMGNGYPIAALVGRADLMRWARLASGTFGGDCIGLAAADVVISRYETDDVTGRMWDVGRRLIDGYNVLAARHGAPTRADGQPPHPRIAWDEDPGAVISPGHGAPAEVLNRHRASLFFQECARRGVLFHPSGFNVSFAHTDEDLEQTLDACDAAVAVTVEAIDDGTVREQIEGDPIAPGPVWRVAP